MKRKTKLKSVAALLAATVMILCAAPINANASQYWEVCFTEDGVQGVAAVEQSIVIVDASGAVTEYVYNSKGLLMEETDPLGAVTTYTYDSSDRLSKTTTPDGTVTEYAYTEGGNITRITARTAVGEEETLRYLYDEAGSLKTAISETARDEYTYTAKGEIASVTRNGKYRLDFAYDEAGNMTELKEFRCGMIMPDSVTAYGYDDSNRLVKVTQDGVMLAEYAYNEDGRLIQQTDRSGNITEYTYDNRNNLCFMETRTVAGIVLYREENSYSADRNLISKKVSGTAPEAAGAVGTVTYTYDTYGRLEKEQGSYGTICYTYDCMGNRLTKTENGVTTFYTYDLCNKLILETVNGMETLYIYDAMGNLIKKSGTDGTTTYIYDAFNQLKKVINPYGICQENEYDAFGIRSALIENGVVTEYMTYNGMLLAGYNMAGEKTEHYSYGSRILARE